MEEEEFRELVQIAIEGLSRLKNKNNSKATNENLEEILKYISGNYFENN
jgi:hypothetical protein